eukprot:3885957-Pyramimonas_sp.AAC.1
MEALESPREGPWPPKDPPGAWPMHATLRGLEGGGPFRRLRIEDLPGSTWHSSTPQRAMGHGGGYT